MAQLPKQLSENFIQKKFYDFSSIARRENLPYYILEIDEVYSDEKEKWKNAL